MAHGQMSTSRFVINKPLKKVEGISYLEYNGGIVVGIC